MWLIKKSQRNKLKSKKLMNKKPKHIKMKQIKLLRLKRLLKLRTKPRSKKLWIVGSLKSLLFLSLTDMMGIAITTVNQEVKETLLTELVELMASITECKSHLLCKKTIILPELSRMPTEILKMNKRRDTGKRSMMKKSSALMRAKISTQSMVCITTMMIKLKHTQKVTETSLLEKMLTASTTFQRSKSTRVLSRTNSKMPKKLPTNLPIKTSMTLTKMMMIK